MNIEYIKNEEGELYWSGQSSEDNDSNVYACGYNRAIGEVINIINSHR